MPHPAPSSAPRRSPAGFTLIEILVVIAIIGLLIGLVAVSIGRQGEAGRIADCRSRIDQISLLVESWRDRMGDYPPSTLAALGVRDANEINAGVEALVAALKSPSYAGRRPEERWLANGDEDTSQQFKAFDGSDALLELVDPWDNPFAYMVSGDYAREGRYRVGYGAAAEESSVRAAVNPLTKAYFQIESFQLRSAGPDSVFGTDDDLANYEIDAGGR